MTPPKRPSKKPAARARSRGAKTTRDNGAPRREDCDNQRARFELPPVEAGKTWEEMESAAR